jgi:hypothetical protein
MLKSFDTTEHVWSSKWRHSSMSSARQHIIRDTTDGSYYTCLEIHPNDTDRWLQQSHHTGDPPSRGLESDKWLGPHKTADQAKARLSEELDRWPKPRELVRKPLERGGLDR